MSVLLSRDIISVDLVNGLFKVKFDLTKYWTDPNVHFMNLKRTKKNFILHKDLAELWSPYVVFFNIESIERIEQSDRKSITYIEPNPSFIHRRLPKTSVTNEYVFRGDNNSLGRTSQMYFYIETINDSEGGSACHRVDL